MVFYKEIDLPKVPIELLNNLDFDNPNSVRVFRDANPINYGQEYKVNEEVLQCCRYRFGRIVDTSLFNWVKNTLPKVLGTELDSFEAGALESSNGIFPPHIDARKFALNYLFDTGGDSIITSWHQQHNKPIIRGPKMKGKQVDGAELIWWHNTDKLDSVIMEKHKWYLIRTDVLHSVTHISGVRKGISIDANEEFYNIHTR